MRPHALASSFAVLSCLGGLSSAAHAQLGAAIAADVIAGLEGGGSGYAAGVRRTRTTLRLGADLWLDEWPNNSLGLGALVELEPVASFGADLRYQRRVADDFVFHAGVLGVLAPEQMVGVTFGVAYRLDLNDIVEINAGPMGHVYFIGSDLPADQILWQATLALGGRVAF